MLPPGLKAVRDFKKVWVLCDGHDSLYSRDDFYGPAQLMQMIGQVTALQQLPPLPLPQVTPLLPPPLLLPQVTPLLPLQQLQPPLVAPTATGAVTCCSGVAGTVATMAGATMTAGATMMAGAAMVIVSPWIAFSLIITAVRAFISAGDRHHDW